VEACPTGASLSGTREEILEEAERRILNDSHYVKHIYGSEEAGGTSVFFISDVPFEKLGFGAPPKQPMPMLTANALGDGPTVILMGGALLSGLYWITQRRAEVAAAENREPENITGKNRH
jgi:formate dehydrogenase iron-sulfur subunit